MNYIFLFLIPIAFVFYASHIYSHSAFGRYFWSIFLVLYISSFQLVHKLLWGKDLDTHIFTFSKWHFYVFVLICCHGIIRSHSSRVVRGNNSLIYSNPLHFWMRKLRPREIKLLASRSQDNNRGMTPNLMLLHCIQSLSFLLGDFSACVSSWEYLDIREKHDSKANHSSHTSNAMFLG